MAFLCPSRLGRSKLKRGYHSMVRKLREDGDTDSLGLEDLVKLSYYTPDARRIILQNFSACASQEISVKQGQKVNFIYNEGDWAYVATDDKKQGFVPLNVCAKLGKPVTDVTQPQKKVLNANASNGNNRSNPVRLNNDVLNNRKVSVESDCTVSSHSEVADDSLVSDWSNDSEADGTSDVTMQKRGVSGVTMQGGQPMTYVRSTPFNESPMHFDAFGTRQPQSRGPITRQELEYFENPPSPTGIYRVLYNYKGTDEYDVTVSADDIVCLLDTRDHDWFWVQLIDGRQGYVPSNYIAPLDVTKHKTIAAPKSQTPTTKQANQSTQSTGNTASSPVNAAYTTGSNSHVCNGRHTRDDVFHETITRQNGQSAPEQYLYSQVSKHRNNSRNRQESAIDPKKQESRIYEEIDAIRRESRRQSRKSKKVPPKKPPRKKRPNQCTSPRSADSLDSTLETTLESINTSVLDSDYGQNNVHSELDDLQPCGPRTSRRHYEGDCFDSEQSDVYTPRTDVYSPDSELYSPRSETSEYTDTMSNTDYDSLASPRYSPGHRNGPNSTRNSNRDSRSRRANHGQMSMPVFRSFEENKRGGYFDQIFYDENESRFGKEGSSQPHSIVNVTEILKLRAKKEREYERHTKVQEHAQRTNKSVPTMKEYLLPLTNAKSEAPRDSTCSKQRHQSSHVSPSRIDSTDESVSRVSVLANKTSSCHHEHTGLTHVTNQPLSVKHKHRRHYDSCSALNECIPTAKSHTDKQHYNSASNLRSQSKGNGSGSMVDKHRGHYGSVNDLNGNSTRIPENDLRRSSRKQHRSSNELQGKSQSRNRNESPNYGHENEQIRHRCGHFSSANDLRNSNSNREAVRPRSNSQGTRQRQSVPDQHGNGQTNSDWSFGYPRKMKHGKYKSKAAEKAKAQRRREISMVATNLGRKDIRVSSQRSNEATQEGHSKPESRRSSTGECAQRKVGYDGENNYLDDMTSENSAMAEVLRRTDALLNKTGILLTHGSEMGDSDVFESDDDDDDESKRFDGTVKCYNFLSSSTIGINGMGSKNPGEDLDDIIINGIGNTASRRNSNESASNNTVDDSINNGRLDKKPNNEVTSEPSSLSLNLRVSLTDVRGITEFVAQCDYEPKANNELPMVHGEILHIGLDNQEKEGWYWAFSPRLRKYGYVPRTEVKIPLVTII